MRFFLLTVLISLTSSTIWLHDAAACDREEGVNPAWPRGNTLAINSDIWLSSTYFDAESYDLRQLATLTGPDGPVEITTEFIFSGEDYPATSDWPLPRVTQGVLIIHPVEPLAPNSEYTVEVSSLNQEQTTTFAYTTTEEVLALPEPQIENPQAYSLSLSAQNNDGACLPLFEYNRQLALNFTVNQGDSTNQKLLMQLSVQGAQGQLLQRQYAQDPSISLFASYASDDLNSAQPLCYRLDVYDVTGQHTSYESCQLDGCLDTSSPPLGGASFEEAIANVSQACTAAPDQDCADDEECSLPMDNDTDEASCAAATPGRPARGLTGALLLLGALLLGRRRAHQPSR